MKKNGKMMKLNGKLNKKIKLKEANLIANSIIINQ